MRTNATFQKCVEAEITAMREYWAGKEASLAQLIGSENPTDARLELRVQREPESNRYAVRAILPLPSATLTAEARAEDVIAAFDCVAELLAEEVQQHRSGGPCETEACDWVEEASAESFPASDPPAWTRVTSG